MSMIKGIDVILYERRVVGRDPFNADIFEVSPVVVKNVLVAPTEDSDIITSTDLTGKAETYTLAIPKGDTHEWEDSVVEFFGHKYRTFGFVQQGIESMIPLSWNKKIKAKRYE